MARISRLLGENLFDHAELAARGEIKNVEREITSKKGERRALHLKKISKPKMAGPLSVGEPMPTTVRLVRLRDRGLGHLPGRRAARTQGPAPKRAWSGTRPLRLRERPDESLAKRTRSRR